MNRNTTLLLMSLFVSASMLGACGNKSSKASIRHVEASELEGVENALKFFATTANGPFDQKDPGNMELSGRLTAAGLKIQITKDGLKTDSESTFDVKLKISVKDPVREGVEHQIDAVGTLRVPNPRNFSKVPPPLVRLENRSTEKTPYVVEAVCASPLCTTVVVRLVEPIYAQDAAAIEAQAARKKAAAQDAQNSGSVAETVTDSSQASDAASKASANALEDAKAAKAAKSEVTGEPIGKKQAVIIFRDRNKLAAEEAKRKEIAARKQLAAQAAGAKTPAVQGAQRGQTRSQTRDQSTPATAADPNATAVTDAASFIEYVLWWSSGPTGVTIDGFKKVAPMAELQAQRNLQPATGLSDGDPMKLPGSTDSKTPGAPAGAGAPTLGAAPSAQAPGAGQQATGQSAGQVTAPTETQPPAAAGPSQDVEAVDANGNPIASQGTANPQTPSATAADGYVSANGGAAP